jgi:hypothetical protein
MLSLVDDFPIYHLKHLIFKIEVPAPSHKKLAGSIFQENYTYVF